MIQLTQDTKLQVLTKTLKSYFTYDRIKSNINNYPLRMRNLMLATKKIIKLIDFKQITLINILSFLINILEYVIKKFNALKNYNIPLLIEYISFYIEYLIDRYYHGHNDFIFMYKCIFSIEYFDLCLKHFLVRDGYEGDGEVSPFTPILIALPFFLVYIPLTCGLWVGRLKDLDKLGNLFAIIGTM